MIVGFNILDFRGHEKEAEAFIRSVCILEDPEVAHNIVSLGTGVNVFSKSVTEELLKAQPFVCSPIEVKRGEYLVTSAVNFYIEVTYSNTPLRLAPTEYIKVSKTKVAQFREYCEAGLVRVIPDVDWSGSPWILDDSTWDDDGVWVDDETWEDYL